MRRKFILRKIQESFSCQRCNECCRQPGFVFLTAKDIGKLARFFKMEEADFIEKHCEMAQGVRVLRKGEGDACIFLDEKGCSVNPAKPKQCEQFPRVWRDPDCFDYCEGIKLLQSNDSSAAK